MKSRSTSPLVQTFLSLESSLKKYLMRFLVRTDDVDDAVQEVFLRAYKAELANEIRSPKSFLFEVAKNFALSEITKKSNTMIDYLGEFNDESVLDDRVTVENNVAIQQQINQLCRVIESLPLQCQRVLVMRKVYGFSHKEVARRLNISVKTVESHLTKALRRIQDLPSDTANDFAATLLQRSRSAKAGNSQTPSKLPADGAHTDEVRQ